MGLVLEDVSLASGSASIFEATVPVDCFPTDFIPRGDLGSPGIDDNAESGEIAGETCSIEAEHSFVTHWTKGRA